MIDKPFLWIKIRSTSGVTIYGLRPKLAPHYLNSRLVLLILYSVVLYSVVSVTFFGGKNDRELRAVFIIFENKDFLLLQRMNNFWEKKIMCSASLSAGNHRKMKAYIH